MSEHWIEIHSLMSVRKSTNYSSDKLYYENLSFKIDFKIILRTIKITVLAKNSDAIVNGNSLKTAKELGDLKKIA